MKLQNHLVVMAKAPRMGRVKTRLANDIGAVAALSFYRHTLHTVVRSLADDERWRTWLCVSPDTAVSSSHIWPHGATRITQGQGDLGQRMTHAMRSVPKGPVVLIGSDIPEITPSHIAAAFKSLGRHEVVFGPAEDGGYWLVGQRRRPRFLNLFSGVRWSHPQTLNDTLKNIPASRRPGLLNTLADVDDGDTYKAYKNRLSNAPL